MKQIMQEFELDLSDQDLTNEELVQKLVGRSNIKKLDLSGNSKINDISPLSRFEELEELIISETTVENLTPLNRLKKLKVFIADDTNRITDISPLSQCKGLEILILTNTKVNRSVFQILNNFSKLKELSLVNTNISGDISDLNVLTKLETLLLFDIDIDPSSLLKLNSLVNLTLLKVDPECEWAKKELVAMLPNLQNKALKADLNYKLQDMQSGLKAIEGALKLDVLGTQQVAELAAELEPLVKQLQTLQAIIKSKDPGKGSDLMRSEVIIK